MRTLRLTDLLGAAGAFAGPPPVPPPAGRFARPEVPDDLLPALAALAALAAATRARVLDPLARDAPQPVPGRPRTLRLPTSGDPMDGTADGAPVPARQVDERACGSAVLTALALAGDPRRALELARWPDGAAAAFATQQRLLHARTTRSAAGWPSWPPALGTPPWGAARVARYGRVRYTHRVVGGRSARAVLAAGVEAAVAGVPVPLYTGGDLAGGVPAAVPRHVVLLTTVRDDIATLYEPSAGRLHAVPAAGLVAAGAREPVDDPLVAAALGGWPHVVWALLPRDARG